MITRERLQELFELRDGTFYWKVSKGTAHIGDVAGCKNNRGYINIRVDGCSYLAHRLIFLFVHGYLPEFLDHVNRICNDNRPSNIRPATRIQNGQNRCLNSNNTSGIKGVAYNKRDKHWVAYISVDGKHKNLGYFKTKLIAAKCVRTARKKLHGEFARHV